MTGHCPHQGIVFELQRRLDDSLHTLRGLDEENYAGRNYYHGATEGLAAALGALQGTNAAHELSRSADRIDAADA